MSAACPGFSAQGPSGVAEALRAVDCASAQATGAAFSRLFGPGGVLGQALGVMLTLYVAWLAISLLTGRSRLNLSALTPRMLALGAILTFATSWVAYQSVVWNLLVGAPDQIATALIGQPGQTGGATQMFAQRLDALFTAVAEAAEAAQSAPAGSVAPSRMSLFNSPSEILSLSALMLLLGTVGVLIVARIALAALLAVGPVFILMSLFRGTRGLFEGWLKGAVMFAITPLLTVLIGGGALSMLTPAIAGLSTTGTPDMRQAVTVFLGASVYLALMAVSLKAASAITSGWRLPSGGSSERGSEPSTVSVSSAAPSVSLSSASAAPATFVGGGATGGGASRTMAIERLGSPQVVVESSGGSDGAGGGHRRFVGAAPALASADGPTFSAADPRRRGLGARFRSPTARPLRREAK